jgi:hypothetical protein
MRLIDAQGRRQGRGQDRRLTMHVSCRDLPRDARFDDYRATSPLQAIFEMISTKLSTETVDNFVDV